MKLKYQLDNLDGLTDDQKALYTEKDGKFFLAIEGMPEDKSAEYEERIGKMDAKINELLDEKKEESRKRREAEDKARQEAQDKAKQNGDVEALEKSWQEKYDKKVKELTDNYEPKIQKFEKLLHESTVMATATQIASEISVPGSSKALLPHIQSRLAMEIKDDKAMTVVRGADGKPSALSLEELKNEFISDEAFAPLIVGSKATGGGASSSNGGAGQKTLKRADFNQKTPAEQMAFSKEGGKIID